MSSIVAGTSRTKSTSAEARVLAAATPRQGLVLSYVVLVLLSLAVIFPLLFALSIAIQGDTVSPKLFPDFAKTDWSVFAQTFAKEGNLGRWILNSFVVSCAVTLGQIVTSALAAYPLAMFRFKGQSLFFFFFIGTLMIPWEATIIPNYLTIAKLGWKDSYPGLIVPFVASGFGVFLLRQSFKAIPRELFEAATMEGCGRLDFLVRILLPLSKPAIATLAIYTFIGTWNQYYWPLLIIDNPIWRTTQVGITAFRSSEIASFNLQMAATIIVMLPTLVLLTLGMRQLVSGLTAGAVKG